VNLSVEHIFRMQYRSNLPGSVLRFIST